MRAFMAFPIPSEVKEYLQGVMKVMARGTEGVKWVTEQGLHITLKFFGEIEEQRAWQFREALADLEGRYEPVTVALGAIDAFPSRKRARVIVVTLKKGIDNIRTIFNDIEDNLSALGVEKEGREFTPHITLGRKKVPSPLLERAIAVIEEKSFVSDRLVLYKSTLTPVGAIYDPLWEIRLGGGRRDEGRAE